MRVSVSALSDRGVKQRYPDPGYLNMVCFSIRSFGSWGEARREAVRVVNYLASFSIRSFGSWGEASCLEHTGRCPQSVSVSALSDRGVKPSADGRSRSSCRCFSIRSFGSWGEASHHIVACSHRPRFQYPLFRIVG